MLPEPECTEGCVAEGYPLIECPAHGIACDLRWCALHGYHKEHRPACGCVPGECLDAGSKGCVFGEAPEPKADDGTYMRDDHGKVVDPFAAAIEEEQTGPSSTLVIENGWVCESVNQHTCGAGPGSYGGIHEPGCGLVPVADITDLLAARDREVAGKALREFVEWVSTQRAYNGAADPGQALYDYSLNRVLPRWAEEYLDGQG